MHPVREQDLFGLFHIFVICFRRISTHFDVNSVSGSSNTMEKKKSKTHTSTHSFFVICQRAIGDLKPMKKNRTQKKPSGFECIKTYSKYKYIFALKWVGFFSSHTRHVYLFVNFFITSIRIRSIYTYSGTFFSPHISFVFITKVVVFSLSVLFCFRACFLSLCLLTTFLF